MTPPASPERRSALADDDVRLLFGDLHNHSLLSDGAGDPEVAFGLLREAGLDVAALTDHASIPHHRLDDLDESLYPDAQGLAMARMAPRSIDDAGWARTAKLADTADEPGRFTALRGFEWTEPWLGHVNVWFSDRLRHVDSPGRIDGLHDWLHAEEPEALFGLNHPGREPGRFGEFAYDEGLGRRLVSFELFNRTYDFLFEGWERGEPSPLLACLGAGWRPGIIGSSDEHGRSYGLAGKGRTGIWARDFSRGGVREALLARRTYATREVGLCLDATLDGVPLGGDVPGGRASYELRVRLWEDPTGQPAVDASRRWSDRPARLQVLGPGEEVPEVVAEAATVPGEVTTVGLAVPEGTAWLLLRVADPTRPNGTPGPDGHPANAYGLAYASPWWLADR